MESDPILGLDSRNDKLTIHWDNATKESEIS